MKKLLSVFFALILCVSGIHAQADSYQLQLKCYSNGDTLTPGVFSKMERMIITNQGVEMPELTVSSWSLLVSASGTIVTLKFTGPLITSDLKSIYARVGAKKTDKMMIQDIKIKSTNGSAPTGKVKPTTFYISNHTNKNCN